MNLTPGVPYGHVRPSCVGQYVPYAFKSCLPRFHISRATSRFPHPAHSQYKQTRWKGSMSRPGYDTRLRCSASNAQSSTSSRSNYAWRKRMQQAKRILFFAGPALSIPLADPAMQLMDSVVIGQVQTMSSRFYHRYTKECTVRSPMKACTKMVWIAVCWYLPVSSIGPQPGCHQCLHIQPHESLCGMHEVGSSLSSISSYAHYPVLPPQIIFCGRLGSCTAMWIGCKDTSLSNAVILF